MTKIMKLVAQNRIFQQVVFWAFAYYVLLRILASSSDVQTIDYIYTAIFIFSIIIPVFINLFVLMPRYLNKNKFAWFVTLFVLNLIIFSIFNYYLFDKFIDYVLPGYYFISYYSIWDILKFFSAFFIITTLLKLSREWFILSNERQRLTLLEKEKTDAELKALMNQVNPHFLFNSLNVLYSLALNDKKETPDAIIKLSDILRYVIYGSTQNSVNINTEIDLIENYIHLQRYRIHKTAKIDFTKKLLDESFNIAPMLLLPLVENSFKHGIKGNIENTFIDIYLETNAKYLLFKIRNNMGITVENQVNEVGGVGLKNIQSRLDLLYHHQHEFILKQDTAEFAVILKITKI